MFCIYQSSINPPHYELIYECHVYSLPKVQGFALLLLSGVTASLIWALFKSQTHFCPFTHSLVFAQHVVLTVLLNSTCGVCLGDRIFLLLMFCQFIVKPQITVPGG